MQQADVVIEKVVYGGKGLSRDLQKVTFVPFTLPGEKVQIRVHRERRDYLEAEAISILEPSADRVVPDCPYYGACGGCHLSHATYDAQLRLKEQMLRESLQRSKVPAPEIQVFPSKPFGSRHRVRLKYNAQARSLGFFASESNRVIDIRECLCATPGINRFIQAARTVLSANPAPGLTEIECFENDTGQTAAYFSVRLTGNLREELQKHALIFDSADQARSDFVFRFRDFVLPMNPGIFVQVNPFLMNAMVQEVESHFQDNRNEEAIELYCGAGFFTVPLSARFSAITACEENPVAIEFARKHHAARNITWIHGKAEQMRIPPKATCAILDPPRTGLDKTVIGKIRKSLISKISYVSCDPASFARDVRLLAPDFRVERLSLLDVFPQTYHFETIALLSRSS